MTKEDQYLVIGSKLLAVQTECFSSLNVQQTVSNESNFRKGANAFAEMFTRVLSLVLKIFIKVYGSIVRLLANEIMGEGKPLNIEDELRGKSDKLIDITVLRNEIVEEAINKKRGDIDGVTLKDPGGIILSSQKSKYFSLVMAEEGYDINKTVRMIYDEHEFLKDLEYKLVEQYRVEVDKLNRTVERLCNVNSVREGVSKDAGVVNIFKTLALPGEVNFKRGEGASTTLTLPRTESLHSYTMTHSLKTKYYDSEPVVFSNIGVFKLPIKVDKDVLAFNPPSTQVFDLLKSFTSTTNQRALELHSNRFSKSFKGLEKIIKTMQKTKVPEDMADTEVGRLVLDLVNNFYDLHVKISNEVTFIVKNRLANFKTLTTIHDDTVNAINSVQKALKKEDNDDNA